MDNSKIASRWRQLSGDNGWDGLLQPLDIDLRRYIIHYGQRAGSIGDVYKYYNKNGELPPKDKFFEIACLEKGNSFKYTVTHYFHAGSWIVNPSWFGFVAVSTDEGKAVLGRRDILIVWRGTTTIREWLNDLNIIPKSASELFGTDTEAMVHSGFLSLYTGTRSDSVNNKISARDQVGVALRELMNKYEDEEISITVAGFSLGGALATLNAMDIVANGHNNRNATNGKNGSCMVTAFTYGCPRVGTEGLERVFKSLVDRYSLRVLRIRNANDLVPHGPVSPYKHVGTKIKIYSSNSIYLKNRWIGKAYEYEPLRNDYKNIVTDKELSTEEKGLLDLGNRIADSFSAHNMDVYLHGIAGLQEKGFRLEVDLDIKLLNKHLDALKDEYNIPTRWWDGENRNKMAQHDNGNWIVKIIKDITRGLGSSQGPIHQNCKCACSKVPH